MHSHANSRRAVFVSDRASPELTRMLASAGLEVRTVGDPCAPDVLLADPQCVACVDGGLEDVIASRAGAVLARLGDQVPALHGVVMEQTERGLFRAVLAHTKNHLGQASKILGLDRNTCARKARAFGLVDEPARGPKPKARKAPKRGAKRAR